MQLGYSQIVLAFSSSQSSFCQSSVQELQEDFQSGMNLIFLPHEWPGWSLFACFGGAAARLLGAEHTLLGEHFAPLSLREDKRHSAVVLQHSKDHPTQRMLGMKMIFLISPFSTFCCLVRRRPRWNEQTGLQDRCWQTWKLLQLLAPAPACPHFPRMPN